MFGERRRGHAWQRHLHRATVGELRALKLKIRAELSQQWLTALDELPKQLAALPIAAPPAAPFPATPMALWQTLRATPESELSDAFPPLDINF